MTDETLTTDTIVDFIADIIERRGSDSYLGEEVTMSQHMLQTAHNAEAAHADDELIAAALLHDIGHYTSEFPSHAAKQGIDNRHEAAGARIVAPYFPERVTECVRYHVPAKRYLCAVDDTYFGQLSDASVLSLKLQGGPMTTDEVSEFEKHPHLDAIVQVRRWDDAGKVRGATTREFNDYRPLLQRVVDSRKEA